MTLNDTSHFGEKGDQSALYFSHIPKTAGTSFTTILDRFFPAASIYPQQLWWDVGDVAAVRAADHRLIRGHFGMAASLLSERPLKTITLLRDPVDLAYSTYQYVKRDRNTAVHDYVLDRQLTFEQFLTDPRTSNLTHNRLIKSLTFGMGADAKEHVKVINSDNYKATKRAWNQVRKQMPGTDLLDLATRYLEDCFWFGLVADFEWSVLMLCQQMAWPPVGPTSKLNRHHEATEISAEAKAIVHQKNPLDVAFYDCAKMLFEQRKSRFLQSVGMANSAVIADDKRLLESVDRHYRQNHVNASHANFPDHLEYDFSLPLLGQNWHRREWSEAHHAYFRWTGPETASVIDFWVKGQHLHMQLDFINAVSEVPWSDLLITVNDHAVQWQLQRDGNQGTIQWTVEPSMTNKEGLLRLKIMNQAMARHQDVFHSTDRRRVCLAVTKITMTLA